MFKFKEVVRTSIENWPINRFWSNLVWKLGIISETKWLKKFPRKWRKWLQNGNMYLTLTCHLHWSQPLKLYIIRLSLMSRAQQCPIWLGHLAFDFEPIGWNISKSTMSIFDVLPREFGLNLFRIIYWVVYYYWNKKNRVPTLGQHFGISLRSLEFLNYFLTSKD